MKNKLITSVVTGLFLLSCGLALGTAHAAGSATLSLSPASGTYNNGSTFSANVYENGNGTPATVVTAVVDYNASQLQLESESCAGAFSSEAASSPTSGSLTISCFTPGGSTAPTSSTEAVALSFKALAGSGTTSVTFGSGSMIADNGTNIWDGNTSGGTFTLATPSSSNGGGSTGGSGSSSNSGSKSNGSTKKSSSSNTTSTSSSSNPQVEGASTTNNSTNGNSSTSANTSKNNGSKVGNKTTATTTKPISTSSVSFVDYASGILAAIVLGLVGFRFLMIRQGKPMPSIYRLKNSPASVTVKSDAPAKKPKTIKSSKSSSATAVATAKKVSSSKKSASKKR